jgi:hypothetical protein
VIVPIDQTETVPYPIFGASVAYQIFEPTSLSLTANHSIGNSVLTDQFTETTSVTGGFRQRFLKHFTLDMRPGYSVVSYKSTVGQNENREDKLFSLYAGISATLFKKLRASIFYQYNDNLSTDKNLAFTSTQAGLQLNYRY